MMRTTTNQVQLEIEWLRWGLGFLTEPNGVVTMIGRLNRTWLLEEIENRNEEEK